MLIIPHFSVFASPWAKKVLNNLLKQGGVQGLRFEVRALRKCRQVFAVGAAISRPQTVDKPIQNKSDSHGESARGDGNPLSRYNLCKNGNFFGSSRFCRSSCRHFVDSLTRSAKALRVFPVREACASRLKTRKSCADFPLPAQRLRVNLRDSHLLSGKASVKMNSTGMKLSPEAELPENC